MLPMVVMARMIIILINSDVGFVKKRLHIPMEGRIQVVLLLWNFFSSLKTFITTFHCAYIEYKIYVFILLFFCLYSLFSSYAIWIFLKIIGVKIDYDRWMFLSIHQIFMLNLQIANQGLMEVENKNMDLS